MPFSDLVRFREVVHIGFTSSSYNDSDKASSIMNYPSFNPSFVHSLPVAAAAIALFCSQGKKIVRAISEFVICVFQEAGRAVLECRKVVQDVRRAFTDPLDKTGSISALATDDFRDLCAELHPLLASKTEELLAR
jgi:hypothetical protein